MQISPEIMHNDVASIYKQQQAIGYESVFIEGKQDSMDYMKGLFHDWQAQGITSVLHEKRGGYANNQASMRGLAAKAEAEGVRIYAGVEVQGFKRASDSAICAAETNQGAIETDFVIVGVGPWVNQIWNMLDLPKTLDVKNPTDGSMARDIDMWTYWSLQEGTLGVDPKLQVTNDGKLPPVIHVDTDAPLMSEHDGSLITDQMWGIYYKPDFHFGGVQGGAQPFIVPNTADNVAVDPYGPESPEFIVGEQFAHMWVSGMAHCQKRFEGTLPVYRDTEPSGGIGCFTPDSFPVFDQFNKNCYIIADSNHGFKMLGVGQLVAREILGHSQELLKPFSYSRFAEGKLHPVSNSPFPWS